jgi:lipooligosaccharide transport system permease protein
MYYQKTFDSMLATPLSLEEIIIAEIAWSAIKSMGAARSC